MIGMFDKQKASLEIFLCIPIQTGVLRQFKISRDWWMDKCKINHTMTTDFFSSIGEKAHLHWKSNSIYHKCWTPRYRVSIIYSVSLHTHSHKQRCKRQPNECRNLVVNCLNRRSKKTESIVQIEYAQNIDMHRTRFDQCHF